MAMTQKQYDETLKAKFLKKIAFVKSYVLKDWTGKGAWYLYIIKNKTVLNWFQRPIQIPANDFGFPSEITIGGMIVQLMKDVQSDLKLLNPVPQIFSETPEMRNIYFGVRNIKEFLEYKVDDFNELLQNRSKFLLDDKTDYENLLKTLKNLENFVSKIFLFQTTIEDSEEKSDVSIIKLENVSLNILTNLTLNQVLEFKKALATTLEKLKNSPFKKAISNSNLFIGTRDPENENEKEDVIAKYDMWQDSIFYFVSPNGISYYTNRDAYITLIHEFGHRYHNRFMKEGNANAKIKKLYLEAKIGTNSCYLKKIPQIGDPLSNLREDWWSVRMASKNYTLTSITNDIYTYTFGRESKTFTKAQILNLMNCPSTYGAKNHLEFFAEMVTLVTLGLVKPSQKVVVDKFLKIIKEESK